MAFSVGYMRDDKETLSDVQLHLAALRGDEMLLKRVLDSGKVHVDCRDEVSELRKERKGNINSKC
ncbi:hypothetical protein ZHAS_00007368 [Anopheles sinensis]|uniref:Uncharacterized protein n=1 Tax=Anopheles sinensis TaxID=74873 RepID=A0A084VPT7_ANOSI|nr:hypothetical protein ZHAS_00007368 [Anopheles sinensis]